MRGWFIGYIVWFILGIGSRVVITPHPTGDYRYLPYVL
jgi:hypothetical protein